MATFSHFKDWIDDTVFVFRDEDEDIISEVKVKIFFENSDPTNLNGLEVCQNVLIATNYILIQLLKTTFSWFSGHNWHTTLYHHLDW